jgi:aminoglycoside phosphotransferase (APT) family kinase protein
MTVPEPETFTVSTRDDTAGRTRMAAWLGRQVGADVEISAFERPSANGMSSDTVLFDATWDGGGGSFVARVEPALDAYPVFPAYDLAMQVRLMRLVGERTTVPVPTVRWHETDPRPFGAPFFVMDRVEGRVPPDVMPYPMGSWVSEATEAERAALQDATVGLIAAIHGLEAGPDELAFLDAGGMGASPLRRHVDAERAYLAWTEAGLGADLPLLHRAFDWLDAHWPVAADERDAVACWGDARIGNVIYDGFTPVAVLDWEMATLAPPELDLGWIIFLHRFFQDICTTFELPGLPTFLRRDDVVASYTRRGGRQPVDLDWFITYAAVRHGTVMARVMGRQVQFGEREAPDSPEELIMHRDAIAALIEGTYDLP